MNCRHFRACLGATLVIVFVSAGAWAADGQISLSTGFDGTWISALGIKWNEGSTARELTIEVKQVRTGRVERLM